MAYESDWFSLPKPWAEMTDQMRANVIAKAGEIHTFDGGHLLRLDGRWEVVVSGDRNDADLILNVLQKPS